MLVGGDWNMTGLFSHILGISSSHLIHIFQMVLNHQPECICRNRRCELIMQLETTHQNRLETTSTTEKSGPFAWRRNQAAKSKKAHGMHGIDPEVVQQVPEGRWMVYH